ncbi:MAG: aspartate aminotransferase family protein [Rhodospirillales bacterium]|nr:aspartate aminotransferase family protein [Rhodospirillales bacterium]
MHQATGNGEGPDRSEGDVNATPARAAWIEARPAETRALLARDADLFLHQALSTPCLDVVAGAEGIYLIMEDGRRVMDFHGNSVHQIGYAHPAVLAAVSGQMARLPFSPRRFANIPATALAARLSARMGSDDGPDRWRALFAPAGTLAVGMAIKLARTATGRHKMLSMWEAFHGASLDAISVGGEAIFRRHAGPLLAGTEHVPPPALAARFFGNDGHAHERLADYIDYILATEGDIAALIAEPVRWTTIEAPPEGFWARVRESCTNHGTLLIFDEIPSGLGRTGTFFAHEQVGAVPDMLVLGKGLGGAVMPIAALLARPGLNVAADAALGHYTHEKSPLGAAAALATLDVIENEDLLGYANALGATALARLQSWVGAKPGLRAARGMGLSLALELDDPARAEAVMYAALARGLSFKIGAGTVCVLCPPLTIAPERMDEALDMLEAALAENA